jgi:putative Mg2+ transporter-C (MgtC) family protein
VTISPEYIELVLRLLTAVVAGAVIGYERSFHARPAGFRTHALVCTASSILMIVTVYEDHWVRTATELIRLDPTRMAQGIMTGIGFLGAGVIIKEGLSVRGLTTAASIWITAAIGILAGIGFYFALTVSVILTLGILSFFRWIEARMPAQAYYHFNVRFARGASMTEEVLRKLIDHHGFEIANFSYRLTGEGRLRSYSMVLRTSDPSSVSRLAKELEGIESMIEYRIAPSAI